MIKRLLLVTFITLVIASCKSVVCTTVPIAAISVSTADTAIHIPDTLMKLVSYPKNGLFQDPVDSASRSFIYYYGTDRLFYQFDSSFTMDYNYDLLCTLCPSGKTFQVTKITHEQNSVQDDIICKKLVRCTNAIHYYVNGKEKHTSGLEGTLDIEY